MILDLTLLQFIFLGLIVFSAAFVQANLGVGFSFIAAPFIPFVEPRLVPVSVLVLGFLTSVTMSIQGMKFAIWSELKISVFGRATGVFLAFLLLMIIVSARLFILIYSCLILISVFFSVMKIAPAFTKRNLFLASIASGLFGTISSVGGPPMAIIYQNREPQTAKYNLSILFTIGTILSLIAIYFAGRLVFRDVLSTFLLLPFCILGIFFEKHFISLSSEFFKNALLIIAGSGALTLLLKTIFFP